MAGVRFHSPVSTHHRRRGAGAEREEMCPAVLTAGQVLAPFAHPSSFPPPHGVGAHFSEPITLQASSLHRAEAGGGGLSVRAGRQSSDEDEAPLGASAG